MPAMSKLVLIAFVTGVVALALAGCGGSGSSSGKMTVTGRAIAGPTCPVERPGDPACAPRPVAGATLVVTTSNGAEVDRTRTAADGTFTLLLPEGDLTLVPRPVEGLMGTAEAIPLTVRLASPLPPLEVRYDTGIR
jgi:hypothetical protein